MVVKKLHAPLLLVVMLVSLAACGGEVGGLFDTLEVANAAETELLDTEGLECEIGFNITNGRLTQVTVVVSSTEVGDLTIDDMVRLIRPVVRKHFKEDPGALVFSVTVSK